MIYEMLQGSAKQVERELNQIAKDNTIEVLKMVSTGSSEEIYIITLLIRRRTKRDYEP